MKTQEQLHDTQDGPLNNQNNLNSSNEELIKKEPIEGTPFTIIGHNEEWNVLLGRYRIGGPFKSKEEGINEAYNTSWDMILKVMQAVVDANHKYEKELEKLPHQEIK